jgi:dTDP-4-dehydrorhamnose reductase
MKILLTGKNGQVGFELQRSLAPLGKIVAVDQLECDLTDQEAIRRLVRETRPDIIVNPAAYTAVDKAESDVETAFAINAAAPGALAEEADRIGALTVHYSTDYVFDGTGQAFYTEDDLPNPQSVYGRSKLEGDQALLRAAGKCLIFRTSWVFGAHGHNFAKTMLRLAAEKDSLNVVADQIGAPTSAPLIADVTAQIIGRYKFQAGQAFPYGLYNLVAAGETSWFEFARTVVASARHAGRKCMLRPENIRPITTAEYPLPASRPANSRLDTKKIRDTFDLHLPDWQDGLEHVLQEIL